MSIVKIPTHSADGREPVADRGVTPDQRLSKREILDHAIETYGIAHWGAGYFDVNSQGHVIARPEQNDERYVDVKSMLDDLLSKGQVRLPVVVRFPQLLTSQLHRLHAAFQTAIQEFDYQGQHFPVFPMKVNPRREVVEHLTASTNGCTCGLECGSKSELYAALSVTQAPESLLICNGFKDESFVDLAMMGTHLGKRVLIVVEKLNELRMVIRRAQANGHRPWVGLRAKLYSQGSGKWASSGGEAAKFGLTTSEILECIRLLKEAGMEESLKLIHFHIGSQITEIKRVKNAMKESCRVYAKLRQMGLNIEYLDIGGGMGVDYDGSKTRYDSSVNYTMQEFANDVVYAVAQVCDDENVPHPHLVTESGRVMTAYHSVFITSIWDEIETFADDRPEVQVTDDDPQVIVELKELFDDINAKNYREYYHDAVDHKDELHTQFNLGLISLEDRADGEVLYWEICAQALRFSQLSRFAKPEFEDLKRIFASKYLCNFSVFRSAPDSWAIGQLFPIMPIHRLDEPTVDYATMVDVTCDSDGQIDKFVDVRDVKNVLELPEYSGEPYYLALFLAGAYQEVMGSHHNLFGHPDEVHVSIEGPGSYLVEEIEPGSQVGDMLDFAGFDRLQAVKRFREQADAAVSTGNLSAEFASEIVERYAASAGRYSYLEG